MTNSDVIDTGESDLVSLVRNTPTSILDAGLLARYVRTGQAFDLSELCRKSGVSLKQVTHLVVASGLDDMDKLPGYTVTQDIYELARHLYAIGETRRDWNKVRTRHKTNYLEGHVSREDLKRLHTDPATSKRHNAAIFFKAWAVFWSDDFLKRMIERVDSRIIESVPEELLTEKTCFAAVAKSGIALRYVPERLRSLPVCIRAVENDPAAMAFTPARFREQIRHLKHIEFD